MASSEIILYTTPQGEIKIEVILQDETVWLTQRAMGELFGVSKKTISEHLGNIYKSNELQREATVRKIRTIQNEGEREVARNLEFYNLMPLFLRYCAIVSRCLPENSRPGCFSARLELKTGDSQIARNPPLSVDSCVIAHFEKRFSAQTL